jgi:hypothetical protein
MLLLARSNLGLGLQLMQSVYAWHLNEVIERANGARPAPDRRVGVNRDTPIWRERHIGKARDVCDRRAIGSKEWHAAKILLDQPGFKFAQRSNALRLQQGDIARAKQHLVEARAT